MWRKLNSFVRIIIRFCETNFDLCYKVFHLMGISTKILPKLILINAKTRKIVGRTVLRVPGRSSRLSTSQRELTRFFVQQTVIARVTSAGSIFLPRPNAWVADGGAWHIVVQQTECREGDLSATPLSTGLSMDCNATHEPVVSFCYQLSSMRACAWRTAAPVEWLVR